MKLLWDKEHFPSCLYRQLLRKFKLQMREHFIKEASRLDALNEAATDLLMNKIKEENET